VRPATIFAGVALLWAGAASVFWALFETYNGVSCSVSTPGATTTNCTSQSNTLVEENGAWVLLLVALPLLITAVAYLATLWQWDEYAGRVATVGLFLFCAVLGFSIGMAYLPSLLLLTVAMFLDRRPAPAVRA